MAVGDESREGQSGKGFSGLSTMVSDVDAAVANAEKASRAAVDTSGAAGQGDTAPQQRQPTDAPQPRSEAYQQPSSQPSSSGGPSAGKWLLGIGAVIGVFWVLSESGNKSTPPSPTYTPSPQPPVTSSPAPSWQPPPAAPRPQTPSRPSEEKPPVGTDLVLSVPQIRYCVAEDIRLDAAKGVINNYVEAEVDRFNAMVADYNSRCGSYRYRRGALESARGDIEPYRSQLQAEGRSRFARPSTGSLSTPAPSRTAPDAKVQAIQRKLNELGYEAGTADGLMGQGTRSAILTFQQDRGLAATGVADQELLLQLQGSPSRSTCSRASNVPVIQDASPRSAPTTTTPLSVPPSPNVQRSAPPANSWASGSNWYCNDGYKKVGNSCEKLNVPRNAWVSGSNWYCNDGFRKAGDQCEALNVPANAWVSGSNWYCNDGYRKVGERCEKLNVPRNAWVSGSNWYCNDGFRKVGDQCVALNVPDNAWVSGSNWYCNDGYRKVGDRCVSVYER